MRLCAALMVISGHMGYILAKDVPMLFGRQIQALGVYIFFLLGGYLITKSWLSDPHPLRYAVRRFMRIWPPLATYVLLATFVIGPVLSTLSAKEYFGSAGFLPYLKNLVLYITYSIPGVFTTNPYPNAVNGSLWTLPVETFMYIIVPFLLTAVRIRKNTRAGKLGLVAVCIIICVLDCGIYLLYPSTRLVVYGTDWISALHIIPFYLIGVVCTIPELQKYFNLQVAIPLLLICSCLNFDYVSMQCVLYIVLPYIIFSFVFVPTPIWSWMTGKIDISYGLYLYGFFIQQIVVSFSQKYGWNLGFMSALFISCVLTTIVAYLSSRLVEQQALVISKKLLEKIH